MVSTHRVLHGVKTDLIISWCIDYVQECGSYLPTGDEIILPPMTRASLWELFCAENDFGAGKPPSVNLFRRVLREDPMFDNVRIPKNSYGAIKCKSCERYKMKVCLVIKEMLEL